MPPRLTVLLAVAALVGAATGAALAADDAHTIVQQGRAFHPLDVTINHGETLNFSNRDEFIHQIYIAAPGMTFDSSEQPPGQDVPVTFPTAGTFEVHCHIHPKMALTVHVK
jgi:plastocyanin